MFGIVGSSRGMRIFSLPFLKLFWSADGLIRDHCEMRSSVTGSGLLVNNISRSSISGSIFYCNYKFFVNLLLERTSAVTIFLDLCCHCFIYLEKKQENVARSKTGILI